jgi:Pyruvate/2-oxoacid:ferredoxin oxidoreductase gamma subunit
MTDKVGPLPFCPGCGHTVLVKALDKALVKLGRDPKDIVVVTDIGCIGLSDRYFITNAFHGLHGRSITYACGLKLARPELTVIALKGDGACGIGGTHVLNVARRNIGITLIVGNNFNYGMTGGQHSVTTPTGGITQTTPWGNVERSMDLCGTAIAAGAPWVYRATMFDKDLADVLATAIEQPGFGMVDVWELCTAYYAPRNKLRKPELFALLDSLGYKTGLLADTPRTEYSAWYKEAYEKGKGVLAELPTIEPKYSNAVERQIGIVIAGSAGQKIRSTATTFARAALASGVNATQKDDYPITVLTGHSVAEIIVSPESIDYTAIESPDYVVLLSEDGVKRIRARIGQLTETCTVYAAESLEVPETKARVVSISLKGVNKVAIATAAVAAMLKDTGLFPMEAFADAFRLFKSPAIAEENLKALATGSELIGKAE